MSTLSADLQSTQSVSAQTLPTSIWNGIKKVAAAVGHYFVVVAEVAYEARKEEIRLRAYYHV